MKGFYGEKVGGERCFLFCGDGGVCDVGVGMEVGFLFTFFTFGLGWAGLGWAACLLARGASL